MDEEIDTTKVFREPPGAQLPMVTLAELEADPHGVFRKYREMDPVVMLETGIYLVLRFSEVDRLSKDARLRAAETAPPHEARSRTRNDL
jgi:cytochrome P450 family 103